LLRLNPTAELTMWVPIGESFAEFAATTCPMAQPTPKAPPRAAVGATAVRSADAASRALDEVMDRYACGDDVAFDELYRTGAPRVRGFLLRLCGDPALADDLTQDAFLRIHRARGSFEAGAAALPWFFAIGRNVFLDHKRREATRRSVAGDERSAGPRAQAEAPPDTRGDEALVASETLDVVRATLEQMTDLQREAFVLIRFEGLSVSEVAQVVGATEAAVKIRAFRAYEALRAALDRQNKGVR
jgi:RNA polymerase sigma-70 factor, ECF subfamily